MPPKAKKTTRKTAGKASAKKSGAKKPRKKVKKAAARKKANRKPDNRRTLAPRKAPGRGTPAGPNQPTIHCTLALTGQWSMVLPTSAIAEITDYAPPAPLENSPEWLLGQIEWEDWQVPVISYGALIDGESPETATARSRIMVIKSLSSTARVPYIGVLVKDIPKLAKVSESDLKVSDAEDNSVGVHCKIKLSGQDGVIPDLERLSLLISHAAYGTVGEEEQVAEA